MNVPELLDRVQNDPVTHLGRTSLRLWQAYLSGYEHGCKKLGVPLPNEPLDRDQFQHWLVHRLETTSEFRSRLNAWSSITPVTYSIFLAQDANRELEVYQALRSEALEELGKNETPTAEVAVESKVASLEGILNAMILRPAMYFMNDWTLANIKAYLNGYFICEEDFGNENSDDYLFFLSFQEWLEKRYPFGKGISWDRILTLITISASSALESFDGHLDMFRKGESHDAIDRGMKALIENIKNHVVGDEEE